MEKAKTFVDYDYHDEILFPISDILLSDSTLFFKDIITPRSCLWDGVAVFLCRKGFCRLQLNDRDIVFREGQVIIVFPNQIIRFLEISEDYFCKLLFFPYHILVGHPLLAGYDFIFRVTNEPCITIPPTVMDSALELLGLMEKHQTEAKNMYRKEMLKTLTFSLILEIGSEYVKNHNPSISRLKSRQQELTDDFFKLLFTHFKQERSVAYYAGELCLTPKYLSTMIKKATGRYIQQWITEVVILDIKNCLKTSNHTITEIAEEYNFPNPSFFGCFFKRHVGMPPGHYRSFFK